MIEDAERPPRWLSAAVPIQRGATRRARPELVGIARAQLLLTEGNSPLYAGYPDGALEDSLEHAHASLLLD